MEGLGVNVIQLVAQIVNFTILIFVLKHFLYKPVLTMLDKRRSQIEEGMQLQEKMQQSSETMKEEQKKMRAEIRNEERRVIKQAVEEAKKREQEILDEVKKEIGNEREKMLGEIERERRLILEQAKQASMRYAVAISEKLLGEKLDKKGQEKLLKEALAKLERK